MVTLLALVLVLIAWSAVSSAMATRRLGGRGQPRRFRQFWRTGVVPGDAQSGRWIAVLDRQRRIAQNPWPLLSWFIAGSALVLAALVGFSIMVSDSRTTVVEVLVTVAPVLLVLAIVSAALPLVVRRRIPRLDQRLAALREHQADAR